MRLSSSSLPNGGFVQMVTKYNGIKSVCLDSIKSKAKDVVCDQLGYKCTQFVFVFVFRNFYRG